MARPNRKGHSWMPAPHYAHTFYIPERDDMYWWCGFCEEHRFQTDKPKYGKCPVRKRKESHGKN